MVDTPSVADVRIVITTSLSDAGVQAMIDDAALIVEQCAAVVAASSAKQKAIVKWVAAHLIAGVPGSTAGQKTSKSIGDASETYASTQLGVNLSGSTYGQRALLLETSGCLANIGKARAFVQLMQEDCD